MSAGVKYDEDKLDYTLLPQPELAKVVETLMYGAKKYPEAHNWLKVENGKNRYIKALLRHAMQAVDEDLDSESGLPHLAHAACCCLFAMHFMNQLRDDRTVPVYVKKNSFKCLNNHNHTCQQYADRCNYQPVIFKPACSTCNRIECECPVC